MIDSRSDALRPVLKILPSDFEPWGKRSREQDWGPDCSCGCRWFVPLEGMLRYDWGVCYSPASPRSGLLTFEHQGCQEFEVGEDDSDLEELFRPPRGERTPEAKLLANLRLYRTDVDELLAKASDHWGYEDPVYRFYHQSFKVYGLQDATTAIVAALQALAPQRKLNAWFSTVVAEGTATAFEMEHNQRWLEVTRPIVEAFFHARFFLEMAVRYGRELEAPPRSLPSGWAAFLYLYDLR